jgi:CubicO group peptidase (beta-lactamase class C family)
MSDGIDIAGRTAPGFEPVIDAFRANFAAGEELGAGFSAFHDGALVVDIWAGFADRDRVVPWTEGTLACVFSSGKAVIAALIAAAASRGNLAYDRPVADYWPEFAASGKDGVTIAMALSHQAGLCGFPDEMPPEEWLDWDKICARLAAQGPLWPPGSAAGYHPQTFGFIAGEILRRVEGRTIGALLRDDFAARGVDIHCGLGAAEIERAAEMTKPPRAPTHRRNSRYTEIAFLKPWSAPARVSRAAWMAAEIPASNMHATARGLAEAVHPLANGGRDAGGARVIEPAALDAALRPRIAGPDLVLPFDVSWTAGLMRNFDGVFGPSWTALGHAGFGGSAAMIDPDRRLSAAYVMNKMSPALVGDRRAVRLFEALARCL